MRFTRLIMVISLAVAILLPLSSYAQLDAASLARAQREQQRQGFGTDNSMGMNGLPGMGQDMMGEEGMEGEQADSTEKEKRFRRPLESYYFSDTVRALPNWKWHIDRYYNRASGYHACRLAYRLCLLPQGRWRYGAWWPRPVVTGCQLV